MIPPWLKPPSTVPLGRHAQLAPQCLHRVRHGVSAGGFLKAVNAARAIGFDAEFEPGVAARPQLERPAQAQHVPRRRHEVGQAEQVVLVAAHAVHQHQQPGFGGFDRRRTVQQR
jgi:hypothetical protein